MMLQPSVGFGDSQSRDPLLYPLQGTILQIYQVRERPAPQYSQASAAGGDLEMNLLQQFLNNPHYFGTHPLHLHSQNYFFQTFKILLGAGGRRTVVNQDGFWLFLLRA